VISRSRKWAEGNAEKVKVAKANNRRRRRATKNASNGHFTAEEFDALCSDYGYACLCCGATDRRLEADHVVPLTKGGSDSIGNIQPLCGECNRRKFTEIIDFRRKVAVQSVKLREPLLLGNVSRLFGLGLSRDPALTLLPGPGAGFRGLILPPKW
jgi:5-methylcytosine-specific restriction endonuclease McrA